MNQYVRAFLSTVIVVHIGCSSQDSAPKSDASVPDSTVVDSGPVDNSTDSDQIPCDARQVLQNVCQRCHVRPPINGAPIALVTRTNMFATYRGAVVKDLMISDLQSGRMPLSPVTIDDASKTTLLTWLQAGAPAVSPTQCLDAGTDAGADATVEDAASDADMPDGDASDM